MGLSRYTRRLQRLFGSSSETPPKQYVEPPAAGVENLDIRYPEDDPATLEIMMADMGESSPLYRPSGIYARNIEAIFEDFKRSTIRENLIEGNTWLEATHGVDGVPSISTLRSGWFRRKKVRKTKLTGYLKRKARGPYWTYISDLNESAYRLAKYYGMACGAPVGLDELQLPDGTGATYTFEIEGRRYTYNFLTQYLKYAYCSRFIDFADVDNVVEIGTGVGRNAALIMQAHPGINYYGMDIAPNAYMFQQVMKSAFGEVVLDYKNVREEERISLSPGDGKVVPLLCHQIETIEPVGKTLLLVSAVFCVLEPPAVENYTAHASRFSDFAFICEPLSDKAGDYYQSAEPVSMSHYERFMGPNYKLVDHEPGYYPLSRQGQIYGGFENMFWTRK